jgi:hypothetical protein
LFLTLQTTIFSTSQLQELEYEEEEEEEEGMNGSVISFNYKCLFQHEWVNNFLNFFWGK